MCLRKFLAVFLVFTIYGVVNVAGDALCSGIDVENDPRVNSKELDGFWYTQRGQTSTRISNTIIFYQFEGTAEWPNDWNQDTKECTYRKFEDRQQQSLENGPFSPCFYARQVLPPENADAVGEEYLFYMPTKNLLMFYQCPPNKVLPNQSCAVRPFVRVMTRTLDITRKELSIIGMRLRRLGINIENLDIINPRENGCPLPMQRGRPGRGYGRSSKQG